jgi:hypothetical protein
LALFHAYEELGRAHVTLGRADEALAAWLSGVKVMRPIIDRSPWDFCLRIQLSNRCLNLAHHLRERGRLAEAADWLLEREKLLPDDALYHRQLSQEFIDLAKTVGPGREKLSPGETTERQRYLHLSARPTSELHYWIPALKNDIP